MKIMITTAIHLFHFKCGTYQTSSFSILSAELSYMYNCLIQTKNKINLPKLYRFNFCRYRQNSSFIIKMAMFCSPALGEPQYRAVVTVSNSLAVIFNVILVSFFHDNKSKRCRFRKL